eukprot:CAMPEP_0206451786 /NCGR_PEP_ID=MMETSP0324_2-20121206/19555_1 /ASSEMBLY_ACC=CAM_ASM_000836 /TAXON_ID=2866 /ORGANISM="Crypthecodinium cohnii, Strain Seligo" /LENGTH=372 /DNA_ID=CAMNT_0053921747 /DNA_START=80 /DNA_END=1198 /DNA_ORIENTATION=+
MEVLASSLRKDGSCIDFSCKRAKTPTITHPSEVIVRMEATPINPSDLGVIFGQSSYNKAEQSAPNTLSSPIDPKRLEFMRTTPYGTPRDQGDVIPGNEGSGYVVAAGSDPKAQALVGKLVAVFGNGGCYSTYRKVKIGNALQVMPDGVTPAQAASSFVNPMTALGFVAQMRTDGHSALVHTAAASQLGQMLTRICLKDGIPLVHVVRKAEQEEILRAIDPKAIIINQTSPTFIKDLAAAMKSVNATLCFDATGGGPLSAQVLDAFDMAGLTKPGIQVYNYGILDTSRSTMTKEQRKRTFFWLLPNWQAKNKEGWQQHMRRVANEILTTFATSYTAEVGMSEAVTVKALEVYGKQETGKKYLLNPSKSVGSKL